MANKKILKVIELNKVFSHVAAINSRADGSILTTVFVPGNLRT
jgi:hypothetical protein